MNFRKSCFIGLSVLLVFTAGCSEPNGKNAVSSGTGSVPNLSSETLSSASTETSSAPKVSSKKEQSNSEWIAYDTNEDGHKLHIKRKDGSEDHVIVNDAVLAPCVAGEWVYYIDPLDKINKVKLDGSQKTKACDTDSIQVYNTENKDYHGLNGSTFITAEYKDEYILYEFVQGQQPGDDFSKPNPPSYYKLDPKTDKITEVKGK